MSERDKAVEAMARAIKIEAVKMFSKRGGVLTTDFINGDAEWVAAAEAALLSLHPSLASVLDGTGVVISRKALSEMRQALIDSDEDGMTEHADCMMEATRVLSSAMLAARPE